MKRIKYETLQLAYPHLGVFTVRFDSVQTKKTNRTELH